jgi:hypothetical protein
MVGRCLLNNLKISALDPSVGATPADPARMMVLTELFRQKTANRNTTNASHQNSNTAKTIPAGIMRIANVQKNRKYFIFKVDNNGFIQLFYI